MNGGYQNMLKFSNQRIHDQISLKMNEFQNGTLSFPDDDSYGQIIWNILKEMNISSNLRIAYWNMCWEPDNVMFPNVVHFSFPSKNDVEQELIRINQRPDLSLNPNDSSVCFKVPLFSIPDSSDKSKSYVSIHDTSVGILQSNKIDNIDELVVLINRLVESEFTDLYLSIKLGVFDPIHNPSDWG